LLRKELLWHLILLTMPYLRKNGRSDKEEMIESEISNDYTLEKKPY
jgi:hypothetical protein